MVRTEHDIVFQVQAAKTDPAAADGLIRQYLGFIRSETVKFLHTIPENGHEDELSIAMLAFYEAILAYEKNRGAFLPYAARAIRNRLIDYYRSEKRHGKVVSLHAPLGGEENGEELLNLIPDTVDHTEEFEIRAASRREIQEFSQKLAQFGLTLSDVADNCPRQERTFAACRRVLDCARAIVRRQEAFFRSAGGHLVPLRLSDVAQELAIHESTVSRAIREKYLQCARGVYPLSFFFSREVGAAGEGTSVHQIKSRLRELVEGEDKARPLSDQKLCQLLEGEGVTISRRTVAKYRDELGISSASGRRARPKE